MRWQALLGRPVFGSAADPYKEPEQSIVAAGQQLANNGVQWIVLDCMGYTGNMRRAITATTGYRHFWCAALQLGWLWRQRTLEPTSNLSLPTGTVLGCRSFENNRAVPARNLRQTIGRR